MRNAAPGCSSALGRTATVRPFAFLGLCALLLGLLPACKTYDPGMPPEMSRRTETGVPEWVGEPLSWQKLADIETWLASKGAYASDFWRIEAKLTLAQGRVEFSRQDRETGRRGEEAIRQRLGLARQGFQEVYGDPAATLDQQRSAQAGLDAIAGTARPAAKPQTGTVLARSAWGAMQPRPGRLTRATGRWTRITVHHSAEAYGPVLDGTAASSADAIRRIQAHMMNGLDYGDIGYHYLIDPQGRVFEGRSMAWQGAHAAGTNNVENIGVCVLGNFEETRPTPEALAALQRTLAWLQNTYRIPRAGVVAHRDLKNTLCPGRNLATWVGTYR